MTGSDRWQRARELAEQALDLPDTERAAWLSNACGDDDELLRLCNELIESIPNNDTMFLESPLFDMAAPTLEGSTLEDLEIGEQIGRGGMATVHRARQRQLDREVAIKFLRGGAMCPQSDIDRFKREARSASRLRHPGIVPVFAVGEDRDLHWFTMELVPGRDLGKELEALRKDPQPHAVPRIPGPGAPGHASTVARLVADVAEALQHAHENGIVHRDVKPENLLLQDDLRVRITDFGIARTEGLGNLTQTGFAAGTAYYMSPEQVAASEIDHRTDIYSLGVVLYELATLARPFDGRTAEIIRDRIRSLEPTPPRKLNPQLPRDLETICLKALHKDPQQRYPTAAAFADDLRRFLNHQAITARPPNALRHVARWARRHAVTLATAAVLIVAAGGVVWWLETERAFEANCALARSALGHYESSVAGQSPLRERAASRALLAQVDFEALPAELRVQAATARLEMTPPGDEEIEEAIQTARSALAGLVHESIPGVTGDTAQALQRLAELLAEAGSENAAAASSLAAALFPRVEIRTAAGLPDDARIAIRRHDNETGLLKEEPLMSFAAGDRTEPVPPGLYRVTLTGTGIARRDFQRLLRTATDTRIDLTDLPTPDTSSMVEIPATTVKLEGLPGTARMFRTDTLSTGRFLIDDAEVTVGQFREFCRKTRRDLHSTFEELTKDDADRDRPATFVTFEEARAFAEYHGKRLPTVAEFWAAVMHASGNRAYPPSTGYEGKALRPYWDRPDMPTETLEQLVAQWRSSTLPARAEAPFDTSATVRSSAGIWHLLGNVAEWTEGVYTYKRAGRRNIVFDERLALGGSWDRVPTEGAYEPVASEGAGPQSRHRSIGFRCVVPLDD